MAQLNIKSLVEKMTPALKQALESAAGQCMNLSHYTVELEHWLLSLLTSESKILRELCAALEIDSETLVLELTRALEKFKTGNTRAPALSPSILSVAKQSWLMASVEFGAAAISPLAWMVALMEDDTCRRQIQESCPCLRALSASVVKAQALHMAQQVPDSAADAAQSTASTRASKTPALDQYTVDLTAQARAGDIDPVVGRDEEIRQCIDVLCRRRQNNPILTGEAGVGKTAVVEGFACRVAEGKVPPALKNVAVRTLDLGLLQAGASVKGEFENRLKSVIEEVQSSPQPIILFVDEAHTLIGAGGKEGQGDAANLIKPALARGTLRTIAATTWAEYKKYFERDPALTRRFQVVQVQEPTPAVAMDMMRAISQSLRKHHGVRIAESAIQACVTLSARYMPNRQLPDKAVSVLDTACARVALSQGAMPTEIECKTQRLDQIRLNLKALEGEHAATNALGEALATLQEEADQIEADLAVLNVRHEQEAALVSEIGQLRQALADEWAHMDTSVRTDIQAQLADFQQRLNALQGEAPLVLPEVDQQAVAEVVGRWTGIPVGKLMSDEISRVLGVTETLQQRVIGQTQALEAIGQAIKTSRAGLTDPRKPLGVFLMVGTSGVGKTETALALAETLFGCEHSITSINMSEFKEAHKTSMLLGSPPGYVGYGEGGVLTEAVRRKPYSVILLDEMEKAHPSVQDIFYDLFDKGTIKDGEGRDIDFKNTLIIMTSNAAEAEIREICDTAQERPSAEALQSAIRPALLQHFKPAFLGRAQVIPYFPLSESELKQICELSLSRLGKRIASHHQAVFSYTPSVVEHIVARCSEVETGARNIEQILNKTLLPELATRCLARIAEGEPIAHVSLDITDSGNVDYAVV